MLAEQLQRRRFFLTASDIGGLFGLSPWTNRGDIYLDKVYGREPKSGPALEAGKLLEPSVLSWASTKLGPLAGGGEWLVHANGILAATLDDQTIQGYPVEAKTSGIIWSTDEIREQWGEEMTDEIPKYYLLQVQTQLLLADRQRAYVPALIGGRGFAMFVVDANPVIQDTIVDRVESFWHNHVIPKIPPADVDPHLETVKGIRREPGKTVRVDRGLVESFKSLNACRLAAEKAEKAAQARLLAAIGDADGGTYDDGDGVMKSFTYHSIDRKGFTVEPTTYRKLSFPSPKKTKGKS